MLKAKCDSKGRLYLREAIRAKYGDAFIVVETSHGLTLLPVPKDPVKDLAELGKALKGQSIREIKNRIRERAKREVGE